MDIIRTNILTIKAHLSEFLKKAQEGETILVCDRNIPLAKIVPISEHQTIPRSVGLAKGEFSVPRNFNEPLEDEELTTFT